MCLGEIYLFKMSAKTEALGSKCEGYNLIQEGQ
jgi:hypothetical protein